MKRFASLSVLIILVACSSATEDNITEEAITTITSTSTTISDESPDTTKVINDDLIYIFDVEKMSPFTGKELLPETWFKRPRRVIAFKLIII